MAKLTTDEWNKTYEYLSNGKQGDYVEHEERVVEITNMAGGRYLHWEKVHYTDITNKPRERWELAGQCDETVLSVHFLSTGKYKQTAKR